ncbi:SprT-like family-domain-containing protein [Protomyces lactucae-debilis]|uniref:SprT-like family-domain-containing protein n=1 Tax=Protomyces lactucae-debilis TaxID=2754530 RepID=A0A1Y2F534_PROLT|nr:SprT-like family-domain-containing protein [Protomyces lactucae-debilis]ORY79020.1 SprT-like family-domain-containing protein [Protomyces lactucae-debilis]
MHTLAQPITIIWSKTLNTTAGRALYRKSSNIAEIELSSKVIDCQARLEATLAHELCHLLTWIVSVDFTHPHGKAFKKHAAVTKSRMGITVSVKHDYEIDYKYQWSCIEPECGKIFGRHSKSIDPSKVCCGACRGKLIQVKPKPRLHTTSLETPARSTDGLSKYKIFLRDNMDSVKASHPGLKYADLVKIIAAQYQASKQTSETLKLPDIAALSLS